MKRVAQFGLLVVVCLSSGMSQRARSVSGMVTDAAGNTLPGTVVQCENTVTLNVQSYIVRSDGWYIFSQLNPDVEFVLKAHYKRWWSKPVTLSKFNENRDPRINLMIPVE
jgi:hypothetical protein